MFYNKKIAIVYKSKYGCTMKYAGWLAIKLNADLYEVSDVKRWDLLKYKTIVFGSPIYNSKIYILEYLLDKFKTIKNKNIILFCVNLGFQSKEEIIDYNFVDEDMKKKIKFFFLDGSIDYQKLNKIDKIKLNRLMKKNIPTELVGIEKNMILDKSNKHTIKPILDYIIEKTY